MPTVTFQPSGQKVEVAPGTTLLSAAQQSGQPLLHFCGGHGICQTCEIRVDASMAAALSEPDAKERRWFDPGDLAAGRRLACCAQVQKDLTVTLPAAKRLDIATQFEKLTFSEGLQLWFRMVAAASEDFLNHARHGYAAVLNGLETVQEKGVAELPTLTAQFVNASLTSGILAFEAVATGMARSMSGFAASPASATAPAASPAPTAATSPRPTPKAAEGGSRPETKTSEARPVAMEVKPRPRPGGEARPGSETRSGGEARGGETRPTTEPPKPGDRQP
ncbi:2Fe-2S iron-sulfur cluster-binding protein [Chloracidobacterium aggregatum]|uniref:2Fe-2S iron-sulfur cluster-binding protein n=1 Tax=Chloracidobacterium aggregatum TaxID=2851959 RepID=UPI001B8C29F2|nr:2Fe-2S iron-sulfur cluster binding domain-containing protein [Chloracidobacterium aggregatum]QUV83881.1 2Fe-2S iron-sulfur cluster binding domain-containing protein [Chloracidobacterium sp. 2]QUV87638.1 2Fe-2S iron-sulfur cluster binding domain-containing protein [Chloracidobacterium sp. S]QUV96940.1 2Fe-2S iron-sulfur cluster binding domain-containing protein [Chloracidobacterium sp. E]